MSDQWMRSGGSAWLDAMLYDHEEPEFDVLLSGDSSPQHVAVADTPASSMIGRGASS
jgi:hypothetical protein